MRQQRVWGFVFVKLSSDTSTTPTPCTALCVVRPALGVVWLGVFDVGALLWFPIMRGSKRAREPGWTWQKREAFALYLSGVALLHNFNFPPARSGMYSG